MPDLSRRGLVLLPVLSWPSRASADDFPLERLMAELAAVPERRAIFSEERRIAALSEPLLSTGHLLYRRPYYLEKVTEWPQKERLVVDGRWLTLTEEGNDEPRTLDLHDQPEIRTMIDGLRGPLAGDLSTLQDNFKLAGAGGLASWTLMLEPRGARALKFLRWMRLAGRGGAIGEIQLVQANGDEQRMQIGPPT